MFYPGSDIFTSKIGNVSSHFTKISCRKRSARSDYLYIFFMKTYFFCSYFLLKHCKYWVSSWTRQENDHIYKGTHTWLKITEIVINYNGLWLNIGEIYIFIRISPIIFKYIMVWILVWEYIFEPFIHILQHFVLQLSRSTNFCF